MFVSSGERAWFVKDEESLGRPLPPGQATCPGPGTSLDGLLTGTVGWLGRPASAAHRIVSENAASKSLAGPGEPVAYLAPRVPGGRAEHVERQGGHRSDLRERGLA